MMNKTTVIIVGTLLSYFFITSLVYSAAIRQKEKPFESNETKLAQAEQNVHRGTVLVTGHKNKTSDGFDTKNVFTKKENLDNNGNIESNKDDTLVYESEKEDMGQEDGAGESILRLGMNNGVNGKMLPIVKASNKIDAIVQVRDQSKTKFLAREKTKKLELDDLKPPDHLDAVRMEQDGHLNKDYKKEIFLGNHEEMESMSDSAKAAKLREIFKM